MDKQFYTVDMVYSLGGEVPERQSETFSKALCQAGLNKCRTSYTDDLKVKHVGIG